MNEAIAKITSLTGIEEETARKAAGMILTFLKKEGPPQAVQKLTAAFPEADQLMSEAEGSGGGLMAMAGSLGGGLMGLGTKLMSLGLSMGQVQSLSRAVFALGRDYAGEEAMGELVASVPGLSQFAV